MAKRVVVNELALNKSTVLLRVDLNEKDENYTKLRASLPTIDFLLSKNTKIILATHIGRPKGKPTKKFSTKPLVPLLKELLQKEVVFLSSPLTEQAREFIDKQPQETIILLENLRFYEQEENNDPAFAHALADLADYYVNDAFALIHRAHASVDAITNFIPSASGFLLEKEIAYLSRAKKPKRPSVWVLGGAKLDKISLVKKACQKADYVLIAGALAFPFLKAQEKPIGLGKNTAEATLEAKKLLKKYQSKIILPSDMQCAKKITKAAKPELFQTNNIPHEQIPLDIGPQTIKEFTTVLRKAHTIVWNGPLGYTEIASFSQGSKSIARLLKTLTATTIVGGGETAQLIHKCHLQDDITHVSTGGGATLTFLEDRPTPALSALEKAYKRTQKQIKAAKKS